MAKFVFVIDPGFVDDYALNGASICKRPYEPSETLIVSVTSDWHLNGIFPPGNNQSSEPEGHRRASSSGRGMYRIRFMKNTPVGQWVSGSYSD